MHNAMFYMFQNAGVTEIDDLKKIDASDRDPKDLLINQLVTRKAVLLTIGSCVALLRLALVVPFVPLHLKYDVQLGAAHTRFSK